MAWSTYKPKNREENFPWEIWNRNFERWDLVFVLLKKVRWAKQKKENKKHSFCWSTWAKFLRYIFGTGETLIWDVLRLVWGAFSNVSGSSSSSGSGSGSGILESTSWGMGIPSWIYDSILYINLNIFITLLDFFYLLPLSSPKTIKTQQKNNQTQPLRREWVLLETKSCSLPWWHKTSFRRWCPWANYPQSRWSPEFSGWNHHRWRELDAFSTFLDVFWRRFWRFGCVFVEMDGLGGFLDGLGFRGAIAEDCFFWIRGRGVFFGFFVRCETPHPQHPSPQKKGSWRD